MIWPDKLGPSKLNDLDLLHLTPDTAFRDSRQNQRLTPFCFMLLAIGTHHRNKHLIQDLIHAKILFNVQKYQLSCFHYYNNKRSSLIARSVQAEALKTKTVKSCCIYASTYASAVNFNLATILLNSKYIMFRKTTQSEVNIQGAGHPWDLDGIYPGGDRKCLTEKCLTQCSHESWGCTFFLVTIAREARCPAWVTGVL